MALCPNCFREQNSTGPCPVCGYDGSGAERKHPQALRPGAILNGRYIVGRVLGQGGFGITYLALDNQTKSRVAIKEYYPAELAGRTMDGCSIAIHSEERAETFAYGKAQFLEEARTLARFLDNPYVVRIHNYFEENGTGYFTMEYVEGPGLDKYMAPFGGRLGVQEAKHLLLPLMEAMDEVHDKGIVHRDVAPDNIIVTRDGRVKLIDFGAARYSTGEKSKSLDVILKHGFAPYEQYMRRGRQGPWTDVYAMAATFYYAITGKVPPDATERKDEDTLIPPSTLGVPIDERTEEALLKALEVSAADRFQRMGDFAAALQGTPVLTREKPPAPRPTPTPAPQPAQPAVKVPAKGAAQETVGKKKHSKWKVVLASLFLLAAIYCGFYAVKYHEANVHAAVGEYMAAKNDLFLPSLTMLHDPQLCEYIDACIQLYDNESPQKGYQEIARLADSGYPLAAADLSRAKAAIYQQAVTFYRQKQYYQARALFSQLGEYSASSCYITLLSAHSHIITVPDRKNAVLNQLSNSLAKLTGFEDADLLLIDRFYFQYLQGGWITEDGAYSFFMDDEAQIKSNLPADLFSKNYTIQNQIYTVHTDTRHENIFAFYPKNQYLLDIYCFKDGKTYSMRRQ